MFFGKVVQLGTVGFNVVQLPWAFCTLGDKFPLAVADGSIAFVLPVDWVMASDFFALEGRS